MMTNFIFQPLGPVGGETSVHFVQILSTLVNVLRVMIVEYLV